MLLVDLEKTIENADRIAAAGKDQDGALTTLAKGVADGMRGLVDLIKGRKMPSMDGGEGAGGGGEGGGDAAAAASASAKAKAGGDGGGEGGGGEGGDGGEDPDEDGDGAGRPGFEDLRLGTEPGDEYVDATRVIMALEERSRKQTATIKELRKAVNTGNTEIRALSTRFEAFIDVYAQNTVTLQKGVMESREALLDIPAQVHAPGITGVRAAAKHALIKAREEAQAQAGLTSVDLFKGLKARVIDEGDARNFKHTGRFVEDDAENAETIEKIKKLP